VPSTRLGPDIGDPRARSRQLALAKRRRPTGWRWASGLKE
jgi:hypothetical protein